MIHYRFLLYQKHSRYKELLSLLNKCAHQTTAIPYIMFSGDIPYKGLDLNSLKELLTNTSNIADKIIKKPEACSDVRSCLCETINYYPIFMYRNKCPWIAGTGSNAL